MQADGESDELKRVLLEGNPIFLAITFVVSLLHSVFDVLAFKNDIGFWRNKKSVEGLSVRTVGINCFCQVRPRTLPLTVQHFPGTSAPLRRCWQLACLALLFAKFPSVLISSDQLYGIRTCTSGNKTESL